MKADDHRVFGRGDQRSEPPCVCRTFELASPGSRPTPKRAPSHVAGIAAGEPDKELRVVDASAFPHIPALFILGAIYMIAEKAREVILDDARRPPQ
jgi:hypothetical protein